MQRYVRPVLFGLLVLAVLLCAVYTGRGTSLVNSFMLDRFADFGAGSPLLSSLLLVALLPAGLLVLLVPEALAVTLAVSDLGFWPGLAASVFALTAAAGTACALTRTFLQGTVRRCIASRRQAGSEILRRATLPVEYCLFLAALLLGAGVPVAVAGMLLGLCNMRTKTFCIAAVPVLFARAALQGLATVEAGIVTLGVLMTLGTLFAAGYLYWVFLLAKKRWQSDRQAEEKALRDAAQDPRQAQSLLDQEVLRLDDLPHETAAGLPGPDSLPAGSAALVVCVTDDSMEGAREAAALVAEAARSLELRVITCRMTGPQARSAGPETTILGGFRDVQAVADLDELFVRAFQEGAGQVLAVRACTPCVRREQLSEALAAVQTNGLALVPLAADGRSAHSYCLAGLARRLGKARYTQGLLARCDFTSDIAFALTGYARHPAVLHPLPAITSCRPLVSVVVLAGEKSTTLASTIYAAHRPPWTQCLAALLPEAKDMAEDAAKAGARVVSLSDPRALTTEVQALDGRYLLLVADGVCVPENFDVAVWEAMQQEKAVLGAFSLPATQPSLQRTLRWLGTVARPGQGAGPYLEQGIFLERELFVRLGGLNDADIGKAVADMVSQAALEGRVVVHNRRVRLLARKAPADAAGKGLLAQAREGVDTILGKKAQQGAGEKADEGGRRTARGSELLSQAQAMVENCDHCGRCTHCSPMLHKHGMDLSDLPAKPLLAWHCFLCNSCTLACDKGIDGVALARLLRRAHVQSHGSRLARPGHGWTLALARLVGVSARSARPGKNLLLDADFCCAYPKTALALAKFLAENGRGVILAESGAALADLGMEEAACRKVAALRRAMEAKKISTLLTISPVTHAWLVSRGISAEPVFTALRELLLRSLDLGPYHVMIPCADKGRESFGASLQPLLSGSFREIDIPCCGGGGEAAVLEPQLASQLKQAVRSVLRDRERVLTYATHCAVSLGRAGVPAEHVLSALFGLAERPQAGPARIAALVRTLVRVAALNRDTGRQQPAPAQKAAQQGLELHGMEDAPDTRNAADIPDTAGTAEAAAVPGAQAQQLVQTPLTVLQTQQVLPTADQQAGTFQESSPARDDGAPARAAAGEAASDTSSAASDADPGGSVVSRLFGRFLAREPEPAAGADTGLVINMDDGPAPADTQTKSPQGQADRPNEAEAAAPAPGKADSRQAAQAAPLTANAQDRQPEGPAPAQTVPVQQQGQQQGQQSVLAAGPAVHAGGQPQGPAAVRLTGQQAVRSVQPARNVLQYALQDVRLPLTQQVPLNSSAATQAAHVPPADQSQGQPVHTWGAMARQPQQTVKQTVLPPVSASERPVVQTWGQVTASPAASVQLQTPAAPVQGVRTEGAKTAPAEPGVQAAQPAVTTQAQPAATTVLAVQPAAPQVVIVSSGMTSQPRRRLITMQVTVPDRDAD